MTQSLKSPLTGLVSRLACLGAALALGACNAPDATAPATPAPAETEAAPEAAPAAEPALEANTEAAAPTLSRSLQVNADADTVWALIGPFCSLSDWHPVVGSCTVNDETPPVRTIITADGSATFTEREVARDDAAHSYAYAILTGPLPVIDYVATLAVTDTAPGVSTVSWSSHYTTPEGMDDAAAAALIGIYEAGFAGITARLAE